VGIIAILAAIAVSIYQNYVTRARISEGLNIAAAAKTSVSEYFQQENAFPADNDQAGLGAPGTFLGSDITRLNVDENVITVTYGARIPTDNGAPGEVTLTATNNGGTISWQCDANNIENKYLPTSCR